MKIQYIRGGMLNTIYINKSMLNEVEQLLNNLGYLFISEED